MTPRDVVERVRRLLTAPRETLPLTLADSGEPRAVLVPYVAILAALGPVSGFLSNGLIGTYIPSQTIFNTTVPSMYVRSPGTALLTAIILYAMGVGAWFLLGLVLDRLAPSFGGKADRGGALKTAAAMLTPMWVAGALNLLGSVPFVGFLVYLAGIAAIAYSVLIGMYAVPLHLSVPEPKAVGHVLASLGIVIVAAAISYALLVTLIVGLVIGLLR